MYKMSRPKNKISNSIFIFLYKHFYIVLNKNTYMYEFLLEHTVKGSMGNITFKINTNINFVSYNLFLNYNLFETDNVFYCTHIKNNVNRDVYSY